MKIFKKNAIAEALLKWYGVHQRELPWRSDRDPYKILLSEVILQQTRVEQGLPYFHRFLELFPTIFDLASAEEEVVLRAWQGLGYYSRARNLHKCTKAIVERYEGIIPSERQELLNLPGIGPYTAAAISSFAYGKKEAVVDGNVIRVITRLFGIDQDVSAQRTINYVTQIADELIPEETPANYNQAIMEFGALHCTPKNPNCAACSLANMCVARKDGNQLRIPVKLKKVKKRTRHFNYLIIRIGSQYLLRKRGPKDIWQGLFEFYLVEENCAKDFDAIALPEPMKNCEAWKLITESQTYRHILSHQTIECRFYTISTSTSFQFDANAWGAFQLYSMEEIEQLPKSILIDRYLREKII